MNYFEQCKPTYLENWPSAMKRLSIAQVGIKFSLAEAKALGTNIIEFGEGFMDLTEDQIAQQHAAFEWSRNKMLSMRDPSINPGPRVDPPRIETVVQDIAPLRARVSEAVATFPSGAFVRLGSRSPKDSWAGQRDGFKCCVGDDPLRFMLDCSERIHDDLRLALDNEYEPWIFVRQWIDMQPESEFRCFMKDRRLVGISQYQYHDFYQSVVDEAGAIEWAIKQFFPSFEAASHLDSVVFDVFVKQRSISGGNMWEVKLLEINPFFHMTDPCLFDWGQEFDGSFRFNTEVQK